MKTIAANDAIAIKTAKRAVLNNIKWLEARIATLDVTSTMGKQMLGFYASKIDAQKMVFEWLSSEAANTPSVADTTELARCAN